jgi:hypothetical protein
MKLTRSSSLLLAVLSLSLFATVSSASVENSPEAYAAPLDIGSALDLAPVAMNESMSATETIYITAREFDIPPVLVAIKRIEPLTSGLVEFVVITSTVDQSVTVAGGC